MKRFHIAFGVSDVEASAEDYSQRLGCLPDLLIPGEYVLWRTDAVNVSIRKVSYEEGTALRHLGWEDPLSPTFSAERDVNGILWECFTADQQAAEIRRAWPSTSYHPK